MAFRYDSDASGEAHALPVLGLDQLPLEQAARIVSLASGDDDEDRALVLRLVEIGFLPGENVRLIAQGSLGRDPLAVRIGRSTFALRRREASLIHVTTLGVEA